MNAKRIVFLPGLCGRFLVRPPRWRRRFLGRVWCAIVGELPHSGWNDFGQAKSFLDSKFEPKGKVWQVKGEDEVWGAWCATAASSGQPESDGKRFIL